MQSTLAVTARSPIKTTEEKENRKARIGGQERAVAGEEGNGGTRNDGDGVRWRAYMYGNMQGNGGMKLVYNSRLRQVDARRTSNLLA